ARAGGKTSGDVLRAGAALSCGGENGTTVSAITAIRMGCGFALDCLPQVLFDGRKAREQPCDLSLVEPGQRRLHQRLAEIAQAIEQRPRRRRQVEALGAAVVGAGAA